MHPRLTASELALDCAWTKSSHSDAGQNCLEVASIAARVAVRDSKNPTGPALLLAPRSWAEFVAHLAGGRDV
ncbi:DUF397 domain-containing protein [Streptomyces pluripotens]|uniref:DUF397 domain-containing protein n=1 Tax=Streptomyces pluripotens TaxID=1355015 RepID=A0A221P3N4_9ACTN|nr:MULTISPECIES: DUF397 domain-containing protein [Streptomyces]ARP72491.1 DUF397 domain-containing protein [Streptomyces pluripotens]ASN26744.1 DUF397 domain-containing protein [Streptomyces pluripotens]KIE26091.1 toxin [Streptomyces sp. MUSC 125]MCH0559531.1 DUF397 domain-containing protein [Streptomyces sp. MUM 16J]